MKKIPAASAVKIVIIQASLFLGQGVGANSDAQSLAGAGGIFKINAQDNSSLFADFPKPSCPAKVDERLAGPDIAGLKLGMSYSQALNFVRCSIPDISDYTSTNEWLEGIKPYQVKMGPQSFAVIAGERESCSLSDAARDYNNRVKGLKSCRNRKRWTYIREMIEVAAPGLPGHEKAVAIWRTQEFKKGQMPAVNVIEENLIKKYGPVQLQRERKKGVINFYWASDISGNPLSAKNPLFAECVEKGAAADSQHATEWMEGCGLNIQAQISLSPDNPEVASELTVSMMHQNNLFVYMEQMQDELDNIEKARRQSERGGAEKAAGDVKL